jgi:hypothetical protein
MQRRPFLLTIISSAAMLPRAVRAALPFSTVFKGEKKFRQLVAQTAPNAQRIRALPIGERTVFYGELLLGTAYKSYTLEIDDRVEAPSVNLDGLDCWTFFEIALAFARMCLHDTAEWSPQLLLRYIEMDRYWGGKCDGSYASRLHYLEDWARDNERRGLIDDLTTDLGGVGVKNAATEMTNNWKGYRYMVHSAKVREQIAELEARLRKSPLRMIPTAKVPAIEPQLRNGDIISIVSRDGDAYGTSHVGLAVRRGGVLRFMHASSPRNHGKVVLDSRLTDYLKRYKSHAGIMVARPLR